jgi:transcriptional regulator with XRE-family HTH domain
MIETKVGNRIKELRNKLGISQEELGFRSGVHRTYIASLEVGKRNVSIATLEKIVIALEVTLSEFFDF